ncbi:OmpA family protein [Myroides sp. LJL119]
MKGNIKKISITLFSFLLVFTSWSQNKAALRGNKQFDNLAYSQAIETYHQAVKKGDDSLETLKNLADSYFLNGRYDNAKIWYEELFNKHKDINSSDVYYNYILSLKSQEDYQKADSLMGVMAQRFPQDNRVRLFNKDTHYLKTLAINPYAYSIRALDKINTPYADFGATMYKGHMIFASSQERSDYYQRIHNWTGDPFTKLYSAEIFIDGQVGKTKPFSKKLEAKFNESTPVFSRDGNTMYFSSNDRDYKSVEDINYIHLYKATYNGSTWGNVIKLPINVPNASSAHPALSPDEKWLYFVSDRDGGFGQSDLYRVGINSDQSFSEVENLGEVINTEARENFPFISDKNVLYFASDGHPGVGGLDIYGVQINSDGSFGSVINLGPSINSPYDDFAFYLDNHGKYGFMTSNRPGGKGKDDLYLVRELEGIDLSLYKTIKGKIYNIDGYSPVSQARISLHDQQNNVVAQVYSNEMGNYSFEDKITYIGYTISVEALGFNQIQIGFTGMTQNNTIVVDFGLEQVNTQPIIEIAGTKIDKGMDLAVVLQMQSIYFGFDKYNITPRAERQLENILQVLRENPTVTLLIRSHTDSRGNYNYNLGLSKKRADSTKAWLVKNGIENWRLATEGVGSNEPLNNCRPGVTCSEEQHAVNRRSEFIVIDF